MLGIAEVLGWLHYDDQSKISEDDSLSFRQLYEPSIPAPQKEGAIKILKMQAETCPDEVEKAELFLLLGVYYVHIRKLEEAIAYLNASEKLYEKNTHQNAIVNWIRGIVFWKTIDHIKAHAKWRVAIATFENLRDKNIIAKIAAKVVWYDEKLEKMKVDITQTAEEAYDWLYRWEPSALDDRSKFFVNEIEERIRQNEYSSAYEIGVALSRISRLRLNPVESAETSVVIGMQYLRMGQAKLAINYFYRAGASFTPGNYQQAVTKWMLGVAQWELSNERDHAFKSWRDAIDLFQEVMGETNRTNDQKKREWLENQIRLMQIALDEKTRSMLMNV